MEKTKPFPINETSERGLVYGVQDNVYFLHIKISKKKNRYSCSITYLLNKAVLFLLFSMIRKEYFPPIIYLFFFRSIGTP